ncbi:hypothetical protein MPSEU_000623100 [Mayamaea pseudoterrestris]|nr:hypothetical protein MPSEU_000623100 [Mayamaea pseudoterrestris]
MTVGQRLRWLLDMDHNDFINEVLKYQPLFPNVSIDFIVDSHFMEKYLLLDEESTQQVLEALQQAPLKRIEFCGVRPGLNFDPRTRSGAKLLAMYQRLCDALGNISTIEDMLLISEDQPWGTLHGCALLGLRQVTCVVIFCVYRPQSAQNFRAIVTGIRNHPNIKSIELSVPTEHYPAIFPIFQTLPSLAELDLNVAPYDFLDVGPGAAHVLADLLVVAASKLQVGIHRLLFLDGSHRILCDGIIHTNIKALAFDGCKFEDAKSLATALAGTHVKELRLTDVMFANDKIIFWESLAPGIAFMHQLEKLSIKYWGAMEYTMADSKERFDAAMAAITCSLACCPRLKMLELINFCISPSFDNALANCIQKCLKLKDLTVFRAGGQTANTCLYPKTMAVLETNYALKRVHLNGADESTRGKVKIFRRLNSAGRGYMATNAANQEGGIQVLAHHKVNSDLSSVFTHVRENPAICRVNIAGVAGRRKRKANET